MNNKKDRKGEEKNIYKKIETEKKIREYIYIIDQMLPNLNIQSFALEQN